MSITKLKLIYRPGRFVNKVGRMVAENGSALEFPNPVSVRFSIGSHSDRVFGILTRIYGEDGSHPIHEYFNNFEPFPDFFALWKATKILENMSCMSQNHAPVAYFVARNYDPVFINPNSDFFKKIDKKIFEKIMTLKPPLSLFELALNFALAQPKDSLQPAVFDVTSRYIKNVYQMKSRLQ